MAAVLAIPVIPLVAMPTSAAAGATRRINFDIPAEPLASALDAYSAATGVEVVYDSALVVHLRAPPVRGNYTVTDALALVLGGSGLAGRPVGTGAITLAPALRAPAMPPEPPPEKSPFRAYFGEIQTGFAAVFCQDAVANPAGYRAVLRFWIDPAGMVEHPQVIGSTGNPRRDQAIAAALRRVRLAAPPPPGLSQPVMMLIQPQQASAATPTCAGSN